MSRFYLAATLTVLGLSALLLKGQQNYQDHPSSRPEQAAASIGLLVDNSHSMLHKENPAAAAMLQLVQTSGPQDEFFVVHFNEGTYLDQDFTTDKKLVSKALRLTDARYTTALNDALLVTVDHLRKASKYKKRILVVITDGSDNNSRASTAQMLEEFKKPNTPVVYCIALFISGRDDRGRKALDSLAKATGGIAFYPNNQDALNEAARRIANEIQKR